MKRIAWKFAASSMVLGLAAVGTLGEGIGTTPAAAFQPASRSGQQAAQLFERAGQAIAENRLPEAISLLEQAVTLSPRDAGYRMMLADAYMKSGRFQSAEATYRDVVSLDAGRARAGLALALMQVANGHQDEALDQLERIEAIAAPADVGLAYALAGAPRRAVEVLEPAARAPGATPRVRQNLAIAYAFGGDWERARTIAAQDVAPSEVAERMAHWATLAPRAGSAEPVAALLGVVPAPDAGQPVQLALNVAPASPVLADQPVRMAAMEPQVAATPAPVEPAAAPAPVAVTVNYAEAAPVVVAPEVVPMPTEEPAGEVALAAAEPAPVPAPAPAESAPARVAGADYAELEAPEWGLDSDGNVELPEEEPAAEQVPVRVRYAAAAEALVRPDPVVMPVASRVARAVAPVAARAFSNAPLPGTRSSAGGFVVQIGAFSSAVNAERAWETYGRRFGLRSEQPVTMTIDHEGRLLHRVALSGFVSRADASRVCRVIKTRGGECFVRSNAGDAAIDWAARYAARA